MNKSLVIGICALAVISAAGLGAFLVLSSRSTQVSPPNVASVQTESKNSDAQSKSIKDLLAMGESKQCEFKDETGNGGTIFTTGGKVRGDFASTAPQGSINYHMIADAQMLHIWMDGQAQGFKASLDSMSSGAATNQPSQVDVDTKFNFDCSDWGADQSKFVLPTDIEFVDLTTFSSPKASSTPEAGSSGTPVMSQKDLQCAACNSLPADSQAACKSALGCN